jgi:hypothetical protein
MNTTYQNAIRDHGKTLITHIALHNELGVELSGGSPAYARQPVTWVNDGNGVMRPSANLTFNIPAGTTVSGWKGFSLVSGGTDYGGGIYPLPHEIYANQGTATFLAATSGILHNVT